MKRFHLMLATLVLAGGALHASEILANPGFESGVLDPWVNGPDSLWTITSSSCHTGNFCATSDDNFALIQTFAGVDTSTISSVSFWIEHPNESVTLTAYDFFYLGGGDDEFLVSTTGTDWNFFDVTSNLRTSDTLVGFEVFGNSGGVTLTDDLSISAAGGAVPEPATVGMLGLGIVGLIAARRKIAR